MSQWLKQSTAITLKLGPFLDDTDGKTAETGLTISQADVRLSKNGGDFAQKNEANAATHDENGYYDVALDTTDTNTLGRLKISVSESGALPVWEDFMVVPANVWDSMFGADYLQVDAVQVEGGDATDQINAACDTALADYDAPTKAEMDAGFIALNDPTAADIADAVLDEALAGHTGAGSLGKAIADIETDATAILEDTGTSLPATLSTIDGKVDTVDGVVDAILTDTAEIGAAGAGLSAIPWNASWDAEVQSEVQDAIEANHLDHLLAADYDPASKPGVATALLNELVESDAGVPRFTANALEEAPTGGSAPTAGEIADAVWDEAIADHDGAGSTGEALAAAGSAGDPWVTALPGAYGAGSAGNIIGNLNDLSAAEVNAEVVDALGTDTIAEMSSGAPPSAPTIKQALMYLYMALRNDTTATRGATKERRIKNDAGTVIAKATTTDDGSVFSQGKLGAP